MDLSSLSNALSPAYLADTARITISPSFELSVLHISKSNQHYNARLTEFLRKFPEHQINKKVSDFYGDLLAAKTTPDTMSFMAHVVLTGWSLTDDKGSDVPFTPQDAIQLFQTHVGATIFGKLVLACQNDALFSLDWSEDAIKN